MKMTNLSVIKFHLDSDELTSALFRFFIYQGNIQGPGVDGGEFQFEIVQSESGPPEVNGTFTFKPEAP